ncbi:MAG: hypothetical protein AAGA15_08640 [Pseudomonadota bacterium]
MFKLSSTQITDLQRAEDTRNIARIAEYLRRTEAADLPPMSDIERSYLAKQSFLRGRELGLKRRNKLCLFAFLVRETGGEALHAPEIEEAMTSPGANPHHVLDEMVEVMKIAAEAEA